MSLHIRVIKNIYSLMDGFFFFFFLILHLFQSTYQGGVFGDVGDNFLLKNAYIVVFVRSVLFRCF